MPEVKVVLSLGSNLGDSAAILQGAVDDLMAMPGLQVQAVSPVFETDPVGGPEQKSYLNAVVLATTTLDPHELLAATQGIEAAWHRVREVRWGPRTLDVDIVAYDDLGLQTDDLVLPHPRAHERAFVLVPWAAVDPEAELVGWGPIAALLAGLDRTGVRPAEARLSLAGRS